MHFMKSVDEHLASTSFFVTVNNATMGTCMIHTFLLISGLYLCIWVILLGHGYSISGL